jgi:hypothetical protein
MQSKTALQYLISKKTFSHRLKKYTKFLSHSYPAALQPCDTITMMELGTY